jgi:glycosyltransferase involved in cell wall biosynthesis
MRVVLHTRDVVGERMAGPGIRAWHLSLELAKHFPTSLVAKREGALPGGEALQVLPHGTSEAREALREADVLVGQPSRGFRRQRRGQRIVFDLFDPTVLELRELYGATPSLRQRVHLTAEWGRLANALLSADLLMIAAPRQRGLYERLLPGEARWIEVPFGIDPREVVSGIAPREPVVLWGGGVWEWLDPATAVDAVVRLNGEGVRAKLLFLGRSRPNAELVDRRREDRFEALLERSRGYASAIEGWTPYAERLSWLRSSRVAVMLHRRTAEAGFSIRTRLFDAIAAGTPVVASAGGFAAELVEQEGLGIVVPPEDVSAVTDAIRRLLTDDETFATSVENLERIRPRFAWEAVARPLVDAIRTWQT